MLYYTGLIFLVIAVSLDGFGVGMTYGLRKIKVPLGALSIIMGCSGLIIWLSMTIGNWFRQFISPEIASLIGGIVLILLGLFSLVNLYRSKNSVPELPEVMKEQHPWRYVLTHPEHADWDESGLINLNESIILGIALALDAFGAGIGASVLGYSPIVTPILVAFMSGVFVFSGIHVGLLLAEKQWFQRMSYLPPILLIILGVMNVFT